MFFVGLNMVEVVGKKAEMTTQQIVMLIILIASFVVVLFFLGELAFGEESAKEVCHNSVVVRSSAIVPSAAVPLDCKRGYVCLSKDGSCENMHKPDIRKVSNNDDVYRALAEEFRDCWWMFGEGEINYIGGEMFPGLSCALCSQIAFDDSVKDIFSSGKIDKKEFYDFMRMENISDGRSYLNYLTVDLSGVDNFGKIDLDKQYYIITGMVPEVSKWKWAATAGIAAPLVFSGGVVVAAGAGAAGYMLMSPSQKSLDIFKDGAFYPPSLVEVGGEFDALECRDIITGS